MPVPNSPLREAALAAAEAHDDDAHDEAFLKLLGRLKSDAAAEEEQALLLAAQIDELESHRLHLRRDVLPMRALSPVQSEPSSAPASSSSAASSPHRRRSGAPLSPLSPGGPPLLASRTEALYLDAEIREANMIRQRADEEAAVPFAPSLAAANSKAAHRAAVARAAQCEDEDCYERLYRSAAEQQLRLRERTAAAAASWSEGHEAPPEPVLLPAAAPDDRWKPPRAATERTEALFEDSKRLQRKKVLAEEDGLPEECTFEPKLVARRIEPHATVVAAAPASPASATDAYSPPWVDRLFTDGRGFDARRASAAQAAIEAELRRCSFEPETAWSRSELSSLGGESGGGGPSFFERMVEAQAAKEDRRRRLAQEYLQETCTFAPTTTTARRPPPDDRRRALYDHSALKEKGARLEEERVARELEHCTFHPTTARLKERARGALGAADGHDDRSPPASSLTTGGTTNASVSDDEPSAAKSPAAAHERLFAHAQEVERKRRTRERASRSAAMAQCTFRPDVVGTARSPHVVADRFPHEEQPRLTRLAAWRRRAAGLSDDDPGPPSGPFLNRMQRDMSRRRRSYAALVKAHAAEEGTYAPRLSGGFNAHSAVTKRAARAAERARAVAVANDLRKRRIDAWKAENSSAAAPAPVPSPERPAAVQQERCVLPGTKKAPSPVAAAAPAAPSPAPLPPPPPAAPSPSPPPRRQRGRSRVARSRSVFERLHAKSFSIARRKSVKRRTNKDSELSGCTFAPRINARPAAAAAHAHTRARRQQLSVPDEELFYPSIVEEEDDEDDGDDGAGSEHSPPPVSSSGASGGGGDDPVAKAMARASATVAASGGRRLRAKEALAQANGLLEAIAARRHREAVAAGRESWAEVGVAARSPERAWPSERAEAAVAAPTPPPQLSPSLTEQAPTPPQPASPPTEPAPTTTPPPGASPTEGNGGPATAEAPPPPPPGRARRLSPPFEAPEHQPQHPSTDEEDRRAGSAVPSRLTSPAPAANRNPQDMTPPGLFAGAAVTAAAVQGRPAGAPLPAPAELYPEYHTSAGSRMRTAEAAEYEQTRERARTQQRADAAAAHRARAPQASPMTSVRLQMRSDLHAQQVSMFDELLRATPDDGNALFGKGLALAKLGRSADAAAALGAALEATGSPPENPEECWAAKAEAEGALGRLDEAIESYRRAMRLAPTREAFARGLAAMVVKRRRRRGGGGGDSGGTGVVGGAEPDEV